MSESKLAAAICAIMSEVGYVQKTGRNTHHRYTYASDADLLRELQPAMARHGLAMYPTHIERTDNGKITNLLVTYELRHSSGETATVMAPGSGADTQDKGPYKAMTGAYKYALRQTFAIPTGDDPEVEPKSGADVAQERRQESPAAKEQRQGEHHPSWADDRKSFCSAIGRVAPGLGYDDVKAACLHYGWGGAPSTWTSARRADFIGAIENNKGGVTDKIRSLKGE